MAEEAAERYVYLQDTFDGLPVLRQDTNERMYEYRLRYAVVQAVSEKAARRIQRAYREAQGPAK